MATIVQGTVNDAVRALKSALDDYEGRHPGSEASLYRRNPASIRIRVVNPRFEGMSKSRRHSDLWEFVASRVPEDTLSDLSLVLTVAPAELRLSLANVEFEHPVPLPL